MNPGFNFFSTIRWVTFDKAILQFIKTKVQKALVFGLVYRYYNVLFIQH